MHGNTLVLVARWLTLPVDTRVRGLGLAIVNWRV